MKRNAIEKLMAMGFELKFVILLLDNRNDYPQYIEEAASALLGG